MTDVLLAETAWKLIGCRYRTTRADIIDLFNKPLQAAKLRFEDDERVLSALQAFRRTKPDFGTVLIVCKASKTAVDGDELTRLLHLR